MDPALEEVQGLRIAIEGCVCVKISSCDLLTPYQGHGTLNAIYAAVEKACQVRGWDGVDLLIIGGDFQVCRNPEPDMEHWLMALGCS